MIQVSNNSIIIRNVDFASTEYLNFMKSFSIYDNLYHKFTSPIITTVNNDVYVPATIGADYIRYYFPKKTISYVNMNANAQDMYYLMKNRPRDDIQANAIKFLSMMKNDKYSKQRFLSLGTGKGKTFVTITMIGLFRKKAMIIIGRDNLADQWKTQFLKHSDIKEDRIKILSGRESVEEAKANPDKYDVYIAIHKTLKMLLDEDPNSLNELNNIIGIGFRVFDEAHLNFKNICNINSLSNVEYTLYLTATPSRSGFREDTLYGKVFKRVPYFNGLKEENIGRYINVVLYKFSSNPDDKTKIACNTKKGFSGQLWSRWLECGGYDLFYNTVLDIIRKFKLIEQNTKTAIVLPTINLIKKLKKDLDEELSLECGIYIGGAKEEENREKAINSLIFITNDKMFGEGIDIQDLEVLVNFVPFTSEIRLEQLMGRIRFGEDKSHVYIDVTDVGFPKCKTQLYARKKFFQKKAKTLHEMKI